MSISDRIKLIRKGLTQKEFARKIGVSYGAIQNWEVYNQVPNGTALTKIRDVFKIDINWLLTGEGEMINNTASPEVVENKTTKATCVEEDTFFSRLKILRDGFGFTQKEVGNKLNVSTNTVQSWEKDTYPKGDALIILSEMFKCSIDWLLIGEGEVGRQQLSCDVTDSVILQHIELIKQFQDRETAKIANMDLLDIERVNRVAFREVVSYIKGVSAGLKLAEQTIDNRGDNYTQDDTGEIKDHIDRHVNDGLRRAS